MAEYGNSFGMLVNDSTSLCITAEGYLAAVPCTAQIGDCIVLLAGGGYPFVLRPSGAHYRFIGPCYVHGIMNGEASPEDLEELAWFAIH